MPRSSLPLFPDAARTAVALMTAEHLGLVDVRNTIINDWCSPGRADERAATLLLAMGAFAVSYHDVVCARLHRDPEATDLLHAPLPHEKIETAARRYVEAVRVEDDRGLAAVVAAAPAPRLARALLKDLLALVTLTAAVDGTSVDDRLAAAGANVAMMAG